MSYTKLETYEGKIRKEHLKYSNIKTWGLGRKLY